MTEWIMWAGAILIPAGFGVCGYLFTSAKSEVKDLWKEMSRLKEDHAEHKLHTEKTYANKADVEKGFDRVMSKLDRIDEKLDNKADRPHRGG